MLSCGKGRFQDGEWVWKTLLQWPTWGTGVAWSDLHGGTNEEIVNILAVNMVIPNDDDDNREHLQAALSCARHCTMCFTKIISFNFFNPHNRLCELELHHWFRYIWLWLAAYSSSGEFSSASCFLSVPWTCLFLLTQGLCILFSVSGITPKTMGWHPSLQPTTLALT